MYAAAAILVALLHASPAPSFKGTEQTRGLQQPLGSELRPHAGDVVENAHSFVYIPFPRPQFGASGVLTPTPDGSVYFFDGPQSVARVSPEGTYTDFPVSGAGSQLLFYNNGSFYLSHVTEGFIKYSADFLHHRYFQSRARIQNFAAGSDGNVYATAELGDGGYTGEIIQIDRQNNQTIHKISVDPYPSGLTVASDGKPYFDYIGVDGKGHTEQGIARLEKVGSTRLTRLGDDGKCLGPEDLASAQNYVYFNCDGKYFGRMALDGTLTYFPLPQNVSSTYYGNSSLYADREGNLWRSLVFLTPQQDFMGYLYQFNTMSNSFIGPIDANLISWKTLYYDSPAAVAADDNIWSIKTNKLGAKIGLGIYVQHLQRLAPKALSLARGGMGQVRITETLYNGPWTAQSSNTSVAVVTAQSRNGTFLVRGIRPGNASIAVRDSLGNTSYEPVTVN